MEVGNFDKLVTEITKNILDKSNANYFSKVSDKSCLIIIPNIIFGFQDYVAYINENYNDYSIYFSSDKTLLDTFKINKDDRINFDMNNSDFLETLDKFEKVIVIGPKLDLLRALIQANDDLDINHIILGRMMANKSVAILINSNINMIHKIGSIIKEIQNMGIDFVNIQNKTEDVFIDSSLITEKDIIKLKDSGLKFIKLSREQLLTPLAKDKLSEYNIIIKYNEEDEDDE